MYAIITIIFNPALDKSTSVAALIAEKKLKCTTPVYEPGGLNAEMVNDTN